MQGIGFAIIAAVWRLFHRDERPGELDDELVIHHHHMRADGELIWHRHLTVLQDHPIALERGHPNG
jgi:hypothetical protein